MPSDVDSCTWAGPAIEMALNGWRKQHWTRHVSRSAMVIAVITSGLMGVMVLLEKLGW